MQIEKAMNSREKGFTLIEVVVCTVLFSLLILVMSSTYSFIRRTFLRVDGKGNASAEIERFLLRLDDELRFAVDITEPRSEADSKSLLFTDGEGSKIGYELNDDGRVIRIDYRNMSKRTLISEVSSLRFIRKSPGLVAISITSNGFSVITAVHVWNLP